MVKRKKTEAEEIAIARAKEQLSTSELVGHTNLNDLINDPSVIRIHFCGYDQNGMPIFLAVTTV